MSQFSKFFSSVAIGLIVMLFVSSSLVAQSDFVRGDLNDDGSEGTLLTLGRRVPSELSSLPLL